MSFCFNWQLLDSLTSESLRRLIEEQLQTSLEDKNILQPSSSPRDVNVSSGGRVAPTNKPSPPGVKPCPLQSLHITDLRWGHVPPFIEVLAMTDGHDFSSPATATASASTIPSQHHNVGPSGRQRSEAGTPPSSLHPTAGEQQRCGTPPLAPSFLPQPAQQQQLSRESSEQQFPCHASDRSSAASTSQLDGFTTPPIHPNNNHSSNGSTSFPAAPPVVRPLRECRPSALNPPPSSMHSSTDDIALRHHHAAASQTTDVAKQHLGESMLSKIIGPNGLYLKFHLTYGGSMSIRLNAVLRTDLVVGVGGGGGGGGSHTMDNNNSSKQSSPRIHSPDGTATMLSSSQPASSLSTTTATPLGASNGGPVSMLSAQQQPSTPRAPSQSIPVTLPIAVTAGNLGIDCFVHVNIFGGEMAVWLETSALSQSPITKLTIQVSMGDTAAAGGGGGAKGPTVAAPPTFFDERFISSMILAEIRGILARSIVAPYFVSVAL